MKAFNNLFTQSNRSILIIDDDSSILNVFTRIFTKKGYAVTVAEKGTDAIAKIEASHFDVAIVDLVLPDMEGTQLFPHIQKTSPSTVKIMLTGQAIHGQVRGFDLLVEKPVKPEVLFSLIETKLKNRNIES